MQTRVMQVRKASINVNAHTFEAVLTTEAPVRRFSWKTWEYYDEVLRIDSASIDSTRINGTLPLLNNHRAWSGVEQIVGRTGEWRAEGGKLIAEVRIDVSDEEGQRIWKKIEGGFIKDFSIGYQILEAEDHRDAPVKSGDAGFLTRTAIKWSPHEASLVTIPADPHAGVRSEAGAPEGQPPEGVRLFPCNIVTRESAAEMTKKKETPKAPAAPATPERAVEPTEPEAPAAPEAPATPERAVAPVEPVAPAANRASASMILERCEQHGLPMDFARGLVDEPNLTTEQALERIVDELATRSQSGNPSLPATTPNADQEREARQLAMTGAMMNRTAPDTNPIEGQARDFYGLSLVEMARRTLGRAGIGLSPSLVLERALHTTSDFALALADVANKTLRKAYEESPQTWKPFSSRVDANDFKTIRRIQTGDHPSLAQVNEHGEFQSGTFTEGQETYLMDSYGVILGLSRKAMINDDLNSLTRVVNASGVAAARLESDIMWALITANAAMADGDALFHANHGNLGTGGAPNETTLTEARKDMRLQSTLDGHEMNLVAQYLMCPAAHEVTVRKLLAVVDAQQSSNVNVFSGLYQMIVEPRLDANSATAWYMSAAPGQIDTLEYAYLSGQAAPRTQTRVGFEVDGMEYKVAHDFGGGVIDHRGLYKNAGA